MYSRDVRQQHAKQSGRPRELSPYYEREVARLYYGLDGVMPRTAAELARQFSPMSKSGELSISGIRSIAKRVFNATTRNTKGNQ